MSNEIMYNFTLNEHEAHALQLAIADQLMLFANITLDPDTSTDANEDGQSTMSMAKDILKRYESILEKIDFHSDGIKDAWIKTYELMKEDSIVSIEDNVINVDFKKEINNAINDTDEEN